jgi:hypothetical protein
MAAAGLGERGQNRILRYACPEREAHMSRSSRTVSRVILGRDIIDEARVMQSVRLSRSLSFLDFTFSFLYRGVARSGAMALGICSGLPD